MIRLPASGICSGSWKAGKGLRSGSCGSQVRVVRPEALHIPQYRLREIKGCRVTQLKPSVLYAYIDLFGLKEWFARWHKANRKLAARLAPDRESDRK